MLSCRMPMLPPTLANQKIVVSAARFSEPAGGGTFSRCAWSHRNYAYRTRGRSPDRLYRCRQHGLPGPLRRFPAQSRRSPARAWDSPPPTSHSYRPTSSATSCWRTCASSTPSTRASRCAATIRRRWPRRTRPDHQPLRLLLLRSSPTAAGRRRPRWNCQRAAASCISDRSACCRNRRPAASPVHRGQRRPARRRLRPNISPEPDRRSVRLPSTHAALAGGDRPAQAQRRGRRGARSDSTHADAAQGWLAAGPRAVVITCGGRRNASPSGPPRRRSPRPRIELADTIGAGDTFTAGLSVALVHGVRDRGATQRSATTAGTKCCASRQPRRRSTARARAQPARRSPKWKGPAV